MGRPLFEFVIRASLIAFVTALVLRALRIKSPGAQHAVWAGMLVTMLALPVWMAWGPKASLPVLPAQDGPAIAMNETALPNIVVKATPMTVHLSKTPATKPTVWSGSAVLFGVYLLGAGILLLRLGIGTFSSSKLTSMNSAVPLTVGLLKPRIILPSSSSKWPQAQLDAVLTHEREHVRRRDPLFQWLALFNRAVFWFHPLAWWLERKLSALAEEACDAAVLERGHDPLVYSVYLLELARTVQRAGTRVNVVVLGMPGRCLPERIRKIVGGVRAPAVSRARMACAALACAIPAALFAAGTLDRPPQPLRLPLWPLLARRWPPQLVAAQMAKPREPARSSMLPIHLEAVPEPLEPPPPKLTGLTIAAIEFQGAGRIQQSVLRSVITSRIGGAYDIETLRRDSETLYRTQRFSEISWETESSPAGVIVRFAVVKRPLIQSIECQCDDTVTVAEILERLKLRKARLGLETLYDENELGRAADTVQELMNARGRRNITVIPSVEPISPPSTVKITFRVEEK